MSVKSAFIGIKFPAPPRIEMIKEAVIAAGLEVRCFATDWEKEAMGTDKEMMEDAFSWIDESDLVIQEVTETSIGVGIEAGYVHLKEKPLIILYQRDAKVSGSIKGIADLEIEYDMASDITEKLKSFLGDKEAGSSADLAGLES